MGILSKRRTTAPERQAPKAVLAAAMPLSGPGVRAVAKARSANQAEGWQKDAWYFYDAVGELRAPVMWIAKAVSKADVFAAEVDPDTGTITGPTENAQAQAAAAMVLGGMSKRSQLQELIALHWQVPGESFIVVRPRPARGGRPQPDEWLALSGTSIVAKGQVWEYTDPMTGEKVTLGSNDRLIRIWQPHPADQAKADSSVRPALVPLREIEKASQNIAARLDSRLAGNGIMFIPQEIDFPLGDHETVALAFMDFLYQAMESSLANPGQASAQVPIVATLPGEFISQIQHLDIATMMDQVVTDLRRDALSRLAATLDMPKPVAEGTQAESNHWSAWQISEDTYRIFIEPLLDRIGDALTEYWYRPVLEAMGVQDTQRYVLAWDTSTIVQRPGETEDLDHLYDLGLISDDYRRAQSGIPDDAVPSEDEINLRRLERVVMGAPTLAADPKIAQLLFGFEIAPAAAGVAESDIEGAPALESGTESEPTAPDRTTPDTEGDVPDGLVAAAEFAVYDALSRAGKRLLTREHRGQFGHVKAEELYLSIPHDRDPSDLLEGSFAWIDGVARAFNRGDDALEHMLRTFTYHLIYGREPYRRDDLRRALR